MEKPTVVDLTHNAFINSKDHVYKIKQYCNNGNTIFCHYRRNINVGLENLILDINSPRILNASTEFNAFSLNGLMTELKLTILIFSVLINIRIIHMRGNFNIYKTECI
jgi:hypothetical protein